MTDLNNFQLLANFNKWANDKIISSTKELAEVDYKKDRGAYFLSIHGTLNHILVVDRAYISRLKGKEHGLKSLDLILYENLTELKVARIIEDEGLIDLVNDLTTASLQNKITYQSFNGLNTTLTVSEILMTLFNHQTHHRGQVHNMLSQAGINPPEIDIPDFII